MQQKQFPQSILRILKRPDLKPNEKLIFMALINQPVMHIEAICQRTALPRSTVYAACRKLAAKKLVVLAERGFVVRVRGTRV